MLPRKRRGFTLIELLMSLVMIGVLVGMSLPRLTEARLKGQIAGAIGDINAIEGDLYDYFVGNGCFPESLAAIDRAGRLDPWGFPYEYVPIQGYDQGKGMMRKDRFLVPINSDFDLYSIGPDGKSASALTASTSHDDVIRANNGGFIGLAEEY